MEVYSKEKVFKSNELKKWKDKKTKELCRCIALFFNYLLLYRGGYKAFSRPKLYLNIVKYVIEELFNCKFEIRREVTPEDFIYTVKKYLRTDIPYDLEIGHEVTEYIWSYIRFGERSLSEGLDFNTELERIKSIRKRKLMGITKEQIQTIKQKIENGEENQIKKMAIQALTSYKRIKSLVEGEIDITNGYINVFDEEQEYVDDKMGVVLSEEDKNVLKEFDAPEDKLKRLSSIQKAFKDKIKKLKSNGVSLNETRALKSNVFTYPQYKSECKELLLNQVSTLDSILLSIERSPIGSFLHSRQKIKEDRNVKTALLSRMYKREETRADKWKRESILILFLRDADYDIRKKPVMKDEHEHNEKLIRGDEDMSDKDLKLTEEKINKEYIDFNTTRGIKEFLKVIYGQLKSKLSEVETDENLKKLVYEKIENKIRERMNSYQSFVSTKKCDKNFQKDNLFDIEIDNCILQSIIYLSVSVSDWLETPTIGIDEMTVALKILLPENLHYCIIDGDEEDDEKFSDVMFKKFREYKLQISDDKTISTVLHVLQTIRYLSPDDNNFLLFNNRIRFFSNSLV